MQVESRESSFWQYMIYGDIHGDYGERVLTSLSLTRGIPLSKALI